MTNEVQSVRPLVLVAIVLLVPAFAGCINLDGGFGNISVCPGQATAAKIIQDSPCTEWVIEIDFVTGHGPNAQALVMLKDRMSELVNKEAIRIVTDETNLPGRDTWTDAAVRDLEESTRDQSSTSNTVVTHLLYLDGEFENPGVAGFAVGSQFAVIFNEKLRSASQDDQALDLIGTTHLEMEQAVLIHEFGHVLGLVNGQTPQQSQHEASTCDTGNGPKADQRHSINRNSVMYCAVESTDALTGIFGDSAPPNDFDREDRADICAAGGRC
jgi:hypothetical protein